MKRRDSLGWETPFFPPPFLNVQTTKGCFTKWLKKQSNQTVSGTPPEFVREDSKLLWKIQQRQDAKGCPEENFLKLSEHKQGYCIYLKVK